MDDKRRPKPYPAWFRATPEALLLLEAERAEIAAVESDPYIETAIANPERINKGCMIYKRGS